MIILDIFWFTTYSRHRGATNWNIISSVPCPVVISATDIHFPRYKNALFLAQKAKLKNISKIHENAKS